jgi:hypothetical protein
MAQSGYTPISFYYSSTTGNIPVAGNLVNGEIAINTADGVIYYKNTGGTVVPLSFGSAAVSWQSTQSSSFTASAGKGYPVNTTSAGVTATLPASPTAGQAVGFVDYAGTFATYNLTINPNGGKILGSTGNVIVTTNRESLLFVYIDSTKGWLPYAGFLGSNPAPATYTASYLVVAGGAGGPGYAGGGGGAGGLLTSTAALSVGTTYTITVGAGGTTGNPATAGNNSSISGLSITSIGGGPGAWGGTGAGTAGGSGGGGAWTDPSAYPGGAGTTGQGNAGGTGYQNNAGNPSASGGGGGAGSAGGTASNSQGGTGGNGLASSITGSSVTYAGGGGGSPNVTGNGGSGGSGGAGNGGNAGSNGTSATANTGSGGGGGPSGKTGGNGGSGVVILSVPTANYSGTTTGSPTVTTSGSNKILTFNSSGSYTA